MKRALRAAGWVLIALLLAAWTLFAVLVLHPAYVGGEWLP